MGWPILAGAAAQVCTQALVCSPVHAAELRLRQAVLTLGGVGTFSYEAPLDPGGLVTLDVRRADVDDVLKSLTVLGGGVRVSLLHLPGPDAAAAALAALPFAPDALGDPLALLTALRGVPIEVRDNSGRQEVLSGRVLGATRDREPAADAHDGLERTRVTLLTASGLRQFVLEEAGGIQVADPQLQARLDAALAALRGQAAGDRRRISLQVEPPAGAAAAGQTVRVAVVTAAPLWKATYRLVLPALGTTTARLQGWAVIENATAGDWDGVAVSLQSGNPVTFRQALYQAVFVDRPEVAVDRQARPAPLQDEAASPPPPPTAAPMAAAAPAMRMMGPPRPMAEVAPAAASEGIAATTYALPTPVTLAVGETASLPFLDTTVPAEPLDLLAFGAAHPRAAVRLANTTGAGLPGGAVATLEGEAFAGDALLPPLPAGERRLLTFAEDLAVTARWDQQTSRDVTGLTVADGVAHLVRTQRTTTRVELAGAAGAGRTLLLEIPRIDGAVLQASGATLSEQTATDWRLVAKLESGGHAVVSATADQPAGEDVSLVDDPEPLLQLRDSQALSPEARAAIGRIAGLRRDEQSHGAERDRLATRRADIATEEQRLRDNLAAVPASDPLHARLLRQLDAAETSLQALAVEADAADAAARTAHEALVAAIASLRIGG